MANRIPEILYPARRFPVRVLQGFVAHRGTDRPAALSYTSLLTLVPLLAVILSITRVFVANQDPAALREGIDGALKYAVPHLQIMSRAEADEASEDIFLRIQESIPFQPAPSSSIRALEVVLATRGRHDPSEAVSEPVERFLGDLGRAGDEALGEITLEELSREGLTTASETG